MIDTKAPLASRSVKNRVDLGLGPDETGTYSVPHPNHAGKSLVVYRLRCIKDGKCRDFVDDGQDGGGSPLNGRQGLQAACLKTVWVAGDPLPVFFSEKRLPPLGRTVVPVGDKQVLEAMSLFVEERQAKADAAAEEVLAQKMVTLKQNKAMQKAVQAAVAADEVGDEAAKRGRKAAGA